MSKQQYQLLIRGKSQNTDREVNYFSYLHKEQLANQPALRQDFLKRFEEGSIDFPPTYKMGRGSLI
jgi:hypothetical protein